GAWTWMVPGLANFLPPRPHDDEDDRLMEERMERVAAVWGRAVVSDDDHHEILWTWGCEQ
ncbi:MAG: hypothetical protein JWP82_927, partial [Humibacillus sp.]|nr:hypothetical protein [Humibacillus sp.]